MLLAADPIAVDDIYSVHPVESALTLGFERAAGNAIESVGGEMIGGWTGAQPIQRVAGVSGSALRVPASNGHVRIEPSPDLNALGRDNADFSMTFWLRLDEGPQGRWRQVLRKGNVDYEREPAVFVHPYSNHLHVRVSTTHSNNEGLDSAASLEVGRWTHVAVVKTGRELSLFLDAELDQSVTLSGDSVANNGPLLIGSVSPYRAGFSIDSLFTLNRSLDSQELEQLSANQSQSLVTAHGNVSFNDVDPDGGVTQYQVITPPAGGHLEFNSDGSFAFMTADALALPAQFTYRVTDGDGNSDTAVARINRFDDAPQANPDSITSEALRPAVGFGFEETGGNDILDFDGVLIGQSTGPQTVQRVPGPAGTAAQFARPGDQVRIDPTPESDALGAADTDFSMAFWLRLDEDPVGYHRQVLLKGNHSRDRGPAIYARPHTNKLHVRLSTTHSFNEGLDSLSSLTAGQWTHVAIVKTGNTWSLYLDGVLDRSTTLLGDSLGNTGPLTIGSPAAFPSKFSIDDVIALNRPLAIEEVRQLAASNSQTVATARGDVSVNDFDLDGNLSHYELVTPPTTGEVDLAADGSFVFATGDAASLPTTFTYRAIDEDGQATTATATITADDQVRFDQPSTGVDAVRVTLSAADGSGTAPSQTIDWNDATQNAFHVRPAADADDVVELVFNDQIISSVDFDGITDDHSRIEIEYLTGEDDNAATILKTDFHLLHKDQIGVVIFNPGHSRADAVIPLRRALDSIEQAASLTSGSERDALKQRSITPTLHYAAADFFQRFNRSLDGHLGTGAWSSQDSIMVRSETDVLETEGSDFLFVPRNLELVLPETLSVVANQPISSETAAAMATSAAEALHGVLSSVASTSGVNPESVFITARSKNVPVRRLQLQDDGNYFDHTESLTSSSLDALVTRSSTVDADLQAWLADGYQVSTPAAAQTLRVETGVYSWTGTSLLASRAESHTASLRLHNYQSGTNNRTSGGATRVHLNRTIQATLPGSANRQDIDISLPSIGIPVHVTRHYDSENDQDVGFGPGWSFQYGTSLALANDGQSFRWIRGDGSVRAFSAEGATAEAIVHFADDNEPGITAWRRRVAGQDRYQIRLQDGTTFDFEPHGTSNARLIAMQDRNGNRQVLSYTGDRLTELRDVTVAGAPQTRLTFSYNDTKISRIADDAGREWSYDYGSLGETDGLLIKVTGPGGAEPERPSTQYAYEVQAGNPRLASVLSSDGQLTTFAYTNSGRIRSLTDVSGAGTFFGYDDRARISSVFDPIGYVNSRTFDDQSRLIESVNGAGVVERYTYNDDETQVATH
ncbi:MAG: LamG-like jellyroll fold domain-containing protein, partial [Planctomycetota bacterium]